MQEPRIVEWVILDLDNNLHDLEHVFPLTMLDLHEAYKKAMPDREISLDEVHFGTRDAFLAAGFFEPPCAFVVENHPLSKKLSTKQKEDITKIYQASRNEHFKAYDGVKESLAELKGQGVKLAVFTESHPETVMQRLTLAGLDGIVDHAYTKAAPVLPVQGLSMTEQYYGFKKTRSFIVNAPEMKMGPDIYKFLVRHMKTSPDKVAMVGDSMMGDIYWSKKAGIGTTIWNEFGCYVLPLVNKCGTWSDEKVKRYAEQKILARNEPDMNADFKLEKSFKELLNYVQGPKAALAPVNDEATIRKTEKVVGWMGFTQ